MNVYVFVAVCYWFGKGISSMTFPFGLIIKGLWALALC